MSDESANEFFGDVVNAGMSRRGVVRVAGVGALVLGLGGATRTVTCGSRLGNGRTDCQHLSALGCWQQAGHAEDGNRSNLGS